MKTKKPESIDEYIAGLDGLPKARMISIRAAMTKAFPGITESIRYGMPAFCLNKTHLYFSSFKQHTGMYAAYAMGELKEKIKPYHGKGTKDSLHFLHKEELPLGLIIEIAEVKFKIKKV